MVREIHSINFDSKGEKITSISVIITQAELTHFKNILTPAEFSEPRTSYMIGEFKTAKGIKAYMQYHNLGETFKLTDLEKHFKPQEHFKLVIGEDGYLPRHLVDRVHKIEVDGEGKAKRVHIEWSQGSGYDKKVIKIVIPAKLYYFYVKYAKRKPLITKEGKDYYPVETFTNIVNSEGKVIRADINEIGLTNENGEVYLGLMTHIQIMGYGGSGGVTFAPTYTGHYKVYLVNGNLLKVVAERDGKKVVISKEESVSKGAVFYTAVDSLLLMS